MDKILLKRKVTSRVSQGSKPYIKSSKKKQYHRENHLSRSNWLTKTLKAPKQTNSSKQICHVDPIIYNEQDSQEVTSRFHQPIKSCQFSYQNQQQINKQNLLIIHNNQPKNTISDPFSIKQPQQQQQISPTLYIVISTQIMLNHLHKNSLSSLTLKLSSLYHQNVIDHYQKPRNVGSLNKDNKNVGTGLVGAPACGDVMKLQIELNQSGDTIQKAVFKTFGCGSAIASSSYATELITGMKVEQALKIKNSDIASYLKLPPVKLHCSMLAEQAIKKAIEDVKTKQQPSQKISPKDEAKV